MLPMGRAPRRRTGASIGPPFGPAETKRGWKTMQKSLAACVFGALIVAAAALPASAADDIESRVQLCAGCHGQSGVPINAATPIIWGQQANYLYKELHDYHSGDRANPFMASVAKMFTLPELREVANYFAAKQWPAPEPAGNPGAAPKEASKEASKDAPKSAEMCVACHQPNFQGGAPAPRLAGLSYDYLLTSMNAFADGKRTNNLDMPGFMKALSQADRDAIAHYLSAL
jgi:cytochrome c553